MKFLLTAQTAQVYNTASGSTAMQVVRAVYKVQHNNVSCMSMHDGQWHNIALKVVDEALGVLTKWGVRPHVQNVWGPVVPPVPLKLRL